MSEEEHHASAMPEGKEPPPPGWRLMAIVRWILVAAMALVAVSAILYGFDLGKRPSSSANAEVWHCPMHPSVVQDHPGECPICGMTLVKREGATTQTSADAGVSHVGHRHDPSDPYACVMHPEETGLSHDDRCPICGMRLEPRASITNGGDAGATETSTAIPGLAPIDLTLERVQLIGMKTAKATREALVPELRTVGYVAAPEGGLAKVTTRFPGWIESLVVSETGRKVKRGELLAVVYSPQVYLAEQEYLTSKTFVGEGNDVASDARKRLELLGVSSAEIDAVEKSGKPKKTIGIVAPATGYVIQKAAVSGAYFQAGTDLFTVANLDKVWVVADVYESELARVKVGAAATLALESYPGRTWSGEVKLMYPNVDPATRTAKIRLELANPGMELRPGMYGTAAIALPSSTGIVIPREALIDTGELQYVFVEKSPGHFEARRVTVGIRMGERVELRSGVAEGETVVTTGNFLLDSESRLRTAIAGG